MISELQRVAPLANPRTLASVSKKLSGSFLCLTAATVWLVLPANAATLATYDQSFAPTFVAGGISASDPVVAGLGGIGSGGYLLAHDGDITSAALALAEDPLRDYSYLEFTINPEPGNSITFSGITFDSAMADDYGPGPMGLVASSSIGGLHVEIDSYVIAGTSYSSHSMTFSGLAFENITTPTTFLLLGYGNGDLFSEAVYVKNLNVLGTVNIPEPATVTLAVMGMATLFFLKHKPRA